MSAYTLKSLGTQPNKMPGIAPYMLVAPLSWFDAISTIAAPSAGDTADKRVTISTAHTMLNDKKWIKIPLAPDKNRFTAEDAGDKGNKFIVAKASGYVAGSSPLLHGTMAELKGEELIVLVKDASCEGNMHYQIGNKCNPGAAGGKFDTNTTADNSKGYEFEVEARMPFVVIYNVAVADADIEAV